MNTPRFNFDRSLGAASRVRLREYSKWIWIFRIGAQLLRDSRDSGRRKIFAIVTPSVSADLGRKPVRWILIFDDHPDSLRLVSERRVNSDAPRNSSRLHVVLGLVLILTLVPAMF